jgi:DNA-binding CsgD family transcriptional regulator
VDKTHEEDLDLLVELVRIGHGAAVDRLEVERGRCGRRCGTRRRAAMSAGLRKWSAALDKGNSRTTIRAMVARNGIARARSWAARQDEGGAAAGKGNMELSPARLERIRRGFSLSPREVDVLRLLMAGCATNAEIANQLKTSAGAIQGATRTLLLKMRVRSRHELTLRTYMLLTGEAVFLDPKFPILTDTDSSQKK